MKWKIIESYKRFNLWHNFKCNYNECFIKGEDPNQLEAKSKEKSEIYSNAQKKVENRNNKVPAWGKKKGRLL